MRSANLAVAVVLLTGLGACNLKALSPDDVSEGIASKAYAEFVTGQDDALLADMPKDTDPAQQRRLLNALRAVVPEGQGQPGQLVGWHFNTGTNGKSMTLTYRYDYAGGHVLFETALARMHDSDPWKVVGVNVAPASSSDQKAPNFGQLPSPPPPKTAHAGS